VRGRDEGRKVKGESGVALKSDRGQAASEGGDYSTVNDEHLLCSRALLNVRTVADDPNGEPRLANLAPPTHVRPPVQVVNPVA